jgi:hypothetical protein
MGGLLWQLGPREGAGLPAALRSEPRGRRELGLLGPEAGGEKFSFFFFCLFFFLLFPNHFQINLKQFLNFAQSHTVQKYKFSSMSAHTCY